jgi:hypothetical protein
MAPPALIALGAFLIHRPDAQHGERIGTSPHGRSGSTARGPVPPAERKTRGRAHGANDTGGRRTTAAADTDHCIVAAPARARRKPGRPASRTSVARPCPRPRDHERTALQPTRHTRASPAYDATSSGCRRTVTPRALTEIVPREAAGRLSASLEGTAHCDQNSVRLVRTSTNARAVWRPHPSPQAVRTAAHPAATTAVPRARGDVHSGWVPARTRIEHRRGRIRATPGPYTLLCTLTSGCPGSWLLFPDLLWRSTGVRAELVRALNPVAAPAPCGTDPLDTSPRRRDRSTPLPPRPDYA